MASKYAVETIFRAVDAMTAPIKKIEGEMKGLKAFLSLSMLKSKAT